MITVEDILKLEKFEPLRKHIQSIVDYYHKEYYGFITSLDEDDLMQECRLKLYDLQKKNKLEKAITGVKNKKGEMIYPRLKIIIKNHLINYIKNLMRDICTKAKSLDELIENNKLIENINIETPKRRDAQELIFLKLIYNKGIKWLNGIPRLYNETFEPIVIDRIEFLEIIKEGLKILKPFEREVLKYALIETPIRKIMASDLKTYTNKIKRAENRIWYILNKLIIESKYKDNPEERNYELKELEYVKKVFKTGETQVYWTGR